MSEILIFLFGVGTGFGLLYIYKIIKAYFYVKKKEEIKKHYNNFEFESSIYDKLNSSISESDDGQYAEL